MLSPGAPTAMVSPSTAMDSPMVSPISPLTGTDESPVSQAPATLEKIQAEP